MSADETVWTEALATRQLRERFRAPGNGGGGRYAFITQVRTSCGFSGYNQPVIRTIDAVTLSLWPSEGFKLDAYEIKVSRADWMAEVRDPEKSEPARELCDAFWIVAPVGMVKPVELPTGWGLIELYDDGRSRQKVKATRKDPADAGPVSRTFVGSLLRACDGIEGPAVPV